MQVQDVVRAWVACVKVLFSESFLECQMRGERDGGVTVRLLKS